MRSGRRLSELGGDLEPSFSNTMMSSLALVTPPSSASGPSHQRLGVEALSQGICSGTARRQTPATVPWTIAAEPEAVRYANHDAKRGIDFTVENHPFQGLSVLDPRVVRIAPGACNEKHRHAHESLFVVIEGEAELQIGDQRQILRAGAMACVPRWVVHQTRNASAHQPLVMLAITDFGLTSAVLGDYDSRTRLRHNGEDAA